MWGFNWVDAVVVVLLLAAVVEGVRIGLLSQLFVLIGFFVTLFVAGWIFPHLLPIHDRTLRTLINTGLVLITAAYAAFRSFDLAQKVHWSFRLGRLRRDRKLKLAETVLGAAPGLLAGLVLVWLLGVAIGRLPFAGLSNSVSDARIVQQLVAILPPVPAVFEGFDRQINPNAPPAVFVQPKPSGSFAYSAADVQAGAALAAPSVVRITSFDCGGIVSGTGFAVAPQLVATNAHVIAGTKRPIVKYAGHSYAGVPVSFDPALDVAVLWVPGLRAPAVTLHSTNVTLGSTVAIPGYPGGNYQVAPGIVRDTLAVSASSIYDQGSFGRGIYEIQAHVDYGSSGSPAVLPDGSVAGIIFSKSTGSDDYAYALTSPHLQTTLHKLGPSHRRVSTRACMVQ